MMKDLDSVGAITNISVELAAARIEEAAFLPGTLCDAMDDVCRLIGVNSLHIFRLDGGPSTFISSQSMTALVERYQNDNWWEIDDRTQLLAPLSAKTMGVVRDQDAVTGEIRKASEIFNDFYKKYNASWCAGWRTDIDKGDWAWSLMREDAKGHFTDAETALLSKMAPAFNRTTRLAMQVSDLKSKSVLEGLSIAGTPAVLLDHTGKVCGCTSAAERLFGATIGVKNGVLWSTSSQNNKALIHISEVAKGRISSEFLSNFIIERMDGQRPIICQPTHIRSAGLDLLPGARLILMFVDTAAPTGQITHELVRLFGLTPSESEVAVYLAQGLSISEIAEVRISSRETVRAQLKQVFQKLNVNRQSDLVRLVDRIGRAATAFAAE